MPTLRPVTMAVFLLDDLVGDDERGKDAVGIGGKFVPTSFLGG